MHKSIVLLLLATLLAACGGTAGTTPIGQISAIEALGSANTAGFARATAPRQFVFPQDHGPHQQFAAEWWYYTGNLATAGGRHFGFQLTFFRVGMSPQPPARASDWAASNIYMAHFALSDVAGKQFYAFDRFSRDAAGLAGAQGDPFRVWLEGWSAEGAERALPMHLRAGQGDAAIDLTLGAGKPPVLQGDRGLSQKSATPGNASYYYSLTRMPTHGTVRVGAASFEVTGLSWMDREWSTSSLGPDLAGWDWFALQLDDGRELMYYQLRDLSGAPTPFSSGALIAADGSVSPIARDDMTLTVLNSWASPHSGGSYPAGWHVQIPSQSVDLTVTPYLADQELQLATVYWEGAVQISGSSSGRPASGNGYVELTGYAEQQAQDAIRMR